MGAPVRFQKAVSRSKERQFPPAGGTGATVRSANGCGVPRPRISALRFPLLGLRRVRNRQFGTTARRDAPRGNAPPRVNKCMEKITMLMFPYLTLNRHARACRGHPRLALRQGRRGWPEHRRAKRRRPSDGYVRP